MKYLFACSVLLLAAPVLGQAPDVKKAEALVKAWLVDNSFDPDAMKILKWGPHDLANKTGLTANDLKAFPLPPFSPPRYSPKDDALPLVRVRLSEKDQKGERKVRDAIFGISKGRIVFVAGNTHGDDWIAEFTKRKGGD